MPNVERTYFVYDEYGNKKEALTKSEIIEAINSAFSGKTPLRGSCPAQGLKEINSVANINLWFGSEDELPAEKTADVFYIVSEHNEVTEIETLKTELQTGIASYQQNYARTVTDLQTKKASADNELVEANEALNVAKSYDATVKLQNSKILQTKSAFEAIEPQLDNSISVLYPYVGKLTDNVLLWDYDTSEGTKTTDYVQGFIDNHEDMTKFRKLLFIYEFDEDPFVQEYYLSFPKLTNKLGQIINAANYNTQKNTKDVERRRLTYNNGNKRYFKLRNTKNNSVLCSIEPLYVTNTGFVTFRFYNLERTGNVIIKKVIGVGRW